MSDRILNRRQYFPMVLMAVFLALTQSACDRRSVPTATPPSAASQATGEPTLTSLPVLPTYTPMAMPKGTAAATP